MKMCLVHDLPFDPSKSILFAIKVSKWRITKKKKKKQNGHSTKQRVVTLDPWGQLIFKQLFLNKFVLDQMDFWRLREQSVCNQTNSHPYFLIEKHWSSWMTYFKPDKQKVVYVCSPMGHSLIWPKRLGAAVKNGVYMSRRSWNAITDFKTRVLRLKPEAQKFWVLWRVFVIQVEILRLKSCFLLKKETKLHANLWKTFSIELFCRRSWWFHVGLLHDSHLGRKLRPLSSSGRPAMPFVNQERLVLKFPNFVSWTGCMFRPEVECGGWRSMVQQFLLHPPKKSDRMIG